MSLVEAHTGVERRHPRHEVVDADDLLLVARADGGAARVAAHAECLVRAPCWESSEAAWHHAGRP